MEHLSQQTEDMIFILILFIVILKFTMNLFITLQCDLCFFNFGCIRIMKFPTQSLNGPRSLTIPLDYCLTRHSNSFSTILIGHIA